MVELINKVESNVVIEDKVDSKDLKVVGVNILIDVKMDIKVENVGDGIVIKVDKED